mmetsp:Transcript_54531/g.90415  ORF Transcript_54531/g.90415 Transcript_54531/m.90415 type:complete len:182 (+) Transcript_54531:45-590(+)|eukprot:CAMPEP_0119320322 /NCGR_PEP_ID=MMETSP1333-20130426/52133_1 /TAXON_ID=418940 /ORGANISM="Scyphosphaera apsteinii, Strain RCC1455" /LENGTH=181 /DNA_ID=CAMNT_0007327019 /DNA_START=29 /DNA_END=574 /DNA_ORIENTATION=+
MVSPLGGHRASELLNIPKAQTLPLIFRSRGQTARLRKTPGESVEHLLLKALLWALYLPQYPNAQCEPAACELDVGNLYRPDVVALGATGEPSWWGECGSVSSTKISALATKFPRTHFTVAKWARSDLSGYAGSLRSDVGGGPRVAPFEVLSFPADSAERFVSDNGDVQIKWDDVLDHVLVH